MEFSRAPGIVAFGLICAFPFQALSLVKPCARYNSPLAASALDVSQIVIQQLVAGIEQGDEPGLEGKALHILRLLPPDTQITVEGDAIYLNGPIELGNADTLQKLMEHRNIKRLAISSAGGKVTEAIKIMRLVRASGLEVEARELCASACTDIFQAGAKKFAKHDAIFMYHRVLVPGIGDENSICANAQSATDAQIATFFARQCAAFKRIKSSLAQLEQEYGFPTSFDKEIQESPNDLYFLASDLRQKGIDLELLDNP
jgi:hypothetical protein